MNEMFILALLAAGGAAVCLAFVKSDKPVISALKSAGCGVGMLMAVNLTSASTGCYIPVNYLTSYIAAVWSIPGVIALLFTNIIFV